MVNQNFKAPGQYSHSRLFFFPLSLSVSLSDSLPPCLSFSPQVQILISQMNTNIYSADVCGGVTSESFQTIKVFVGAAGCNAAFGGFLPLPHARAPTRPKGGENITFRRIFILF